MKKVTCFLLLIISMSSTVFSQITVNSLSDLRTYLDKDSVSVKLAPGTYEITADNVHDYVWADSVGTQSINTIFLFSGNGSTYDFTDVKITVATGVFREFGLFEVYEIRIAGNYNTLKNLKITDVGGVNDYPYKGALSIAIDGKYNVVDGFDVFATGSLPYGYGDIFGKGSNPMTKHRKHSGILIRGDYNTLKNTTMIHRAFGHCVFMQAANHPTIDSCYIEGEMRKTDNILAEEGTGTTADNLDFMTVWGYKLPAGFMIALCEAGIRSYDAGATTINGVAYSRGTNDITIKNTTVKNTRSGCTISQSSGDNLVENVTLIGNENGFAIGHGEVINGRADAAYGPAFNCDGSGITGDVTIIPPENGYYNGSDALINMTSGELVVKTEEENIPDSLFVDLGTYRSFRHQSGSTLMYQIDTIASGATLYNHTVAPIVLAKGSKNNDIYTCDTVIDLGSTNTTITPLSDCDVEIPCDNTTSLIQAECFNGMNGIDDEGENIGSITNGTWACYNTIDLSYMNSVHVVASSKGVGGTIEFRLDAVDGTLIGSVDVGITGSWTNWKTFSANIIPTTGVHNIYTVFTGKTGWLYNIDNFGFSTDKFVTGVTVKPSSLELVIGDIDTIATIVTPNDATNGKVTWQSSKSAKAKVDSLGVVTALDSGIVFIIATTDDGKFSDSCMVTIAPSISTATKMVIPNSNEKLKVYPNPINSNFVIELDTDKKALYKVYDINGKVVLSGKTTGRKTTIDESKLAFGIYLVKVGDKTKIVYKTKE